MNTTIPANEFDYLEKLILYRLDRQLALAQGQPVAETPGGFDPVNDFPSLEKWQLPVQKFADDNGLGQYNEQHHYKNQDELLVLLIGLVPHLKPDLFDRCISEKVNGSDYPYIGGVRGKNCRFFLPTGETVLFVLAGEDFDRRLQVRQLFGAEHIFWQKKIIWLEDMQNGEPAMHGRVIISPDYADLLTYGIHQSPQFSITFPAKKIAPPKNKEQSNAPTFDDLVIADELKEQVNELESWLTYNDELMNKFGMKNRLKKGYRALFYGPPGTGKTFTAEILGNHLGKDVYKIDLSMVVSKYIGETEKNLELLFARAEDKGWILFFDEADALFGKRTNVRDAHDKYANQEVSYLLQRIEDYNGLVILATNMKNNIDDAFIRRFNSILKFPFPDPAQRAEIWKKALPKTAVYRKKMLTGDLPEVKEVEADIPEAVKKYELT
ncbi:MAG: ATP-binding protein, partial [Flavisolibacter sp.]